MRSGINNIENTQESEISDDEVEAVAGGSVEYVDKDGKRILNLPENAPRESPQKVHSTYNAKRSR